MLVGEPGDAVDDTGFLFTTSEASEFFSSFMKSFCAGAAALAWAGLDGTLGGDSVYGRVFLISVKSLNGLDWLACDCETDRPGKVA